MMTNNKPWQALVNPANLAQANPSQNNLAVVKKNTTPVQEFSAKLKTVNPKRYSFDDNGGGYQGL